MSPSWEIIAEQLRNELQSYGGLLHLFNEQQQNLLRGDAAAVLSYASEIEAQARATVAIRERREQIVRDFAEEHAQPPTSALRPLMTLFPLDVRPLLTALIDEVNLLIHRVRRGAKRNHQILTRVVEVHQDTLRTLKPAAFGKTYSSRGQVQLVGDQPGWQAAG